jgi:CxxC-x17-CxxC domain-containing protein
MSDSYFEGIREISTHPLETSDEFEDLSIPCIDCSSDFIWTGGEQAFFRDKELLNPPKRCKDCKKAKNQRLDAIETARLTGKKHRIEIRADCAKCAASTTVPFYPCQGRPVYCRACFLEMNSNGAHGHA